MWKKIFSLLCVVAILATGCNVMNRYFSEDPVGSGGYEYEDASNSDGSYIGDFMVYVQVPDGWSEVFLWAGADGVTGMFPGFPGMLMAPQEDGWYSIPVYGMFEYVVISANGGAAVTDLIYCSGEDMRVEILEASYTYSGATQGSGVIHAITDFEMSAFGGLDGYHQILESIKQPDYRVVDPSLEVMALLGYREDIPVKMEYGYNAAGLKELSIQTYYDTTGMSDEDVLAFIGEMRNQYQIELSGYGCIQVWDELRDAYIVLVVYCTDLQEPAYSRTVAALFGNGDIPVDGDFVRMPTASEAEAMGYCVKTEG